MMSAISVDINASLKLKANASINVFELKALINQLNVKPLMGNEIVFSVPKAVTVIINNGKNKKIKTAREIKVKNLFLQIGRASCRERV